MPTVWVVRQDIGWGDEVVLGLGKAKPKVDKGNATLRFKDELILSMGEFKKLTGLSLKKGESLLLEVTAEVEKPAVKRGNKRR